ncbi:transcriptional activator NhaR [Steroidobacter agaridevorans]|uniref:Transcriptional activator NhaR n=1 Tax=Steroidobacter agaridevorans TaxID=2695856 RepID=A0A829YB01_9GAMM|nr:transcriptional activator NhaR [Steroidobacter agaridevorans]GFE80285.1 transcriptional activator NhaR [Steroidobacter agaridevorans]GFE87338.1 transcriptional activator NhaR [Steroidobacter agaridevorans]
MASIPRINYQHLMYFWSVVRTGSLTRACEELALSAPTVSSQLRILEERLGEKLLLKSGRNLVPTDVGKMVYSYANEIFSLGQELLDALEQRPSSRPLRLVVGIDDVVPKEIAYQIVEPGMHLEQSVRVVCRESTLERLIADLAVHDIDVVLSDAPVTPTLNVRVYSHPLGSCNVYWMATPALARTLRRGFPQSLDGVPALLPTDDTAIRRALDQWLDRQNVRPLPLGEFEDYAMLREFARAGHGFAPVPSVLEAQFRRDNGFVRIGMARGVKAEFYAISAERKIRHPAVIAMTDSARQLFAQK